MAKVSPRQIGDKRLGRPADDWIDAGDGASSDPGIARIRGAILDHPGRAVLRHLVELAHFYDFDPTDPDVIARAVTAAEREYAEDVEIAAHRYAIRRGHEAIVYYMRVGDRVKIGTSTNIIARLENFNPEELMAMERGGHAVEQQRHQTFADLRTTGEWFRLDPSLTAFIGVLRSNFEREFGMSLKEWMLGHATVTEV